MEKISSVPSNYYRTTGCVIIQVYCLRIFPPIDEVVLPEVSESSGVFWPVSTMNGFGQTINFRMKVNSF